MDRQSTRQLTFFQLIRHKINTQKLIQCFILLITLAPLSICYAKKHYNTIDNKLFHLIPDHQSIYRIEKFGTDIGNVINTLRYQKNVINYTSKASAKGIASFFIKDDHEEISILHWSQNMPRPTQQSFSYFHGKKHKKNQQILFKHITPGETRLEGSYKRKSYILKTNKTIWSRQMLPLLMSEQLQHKPDTKTQKFYIINKGRIQKYDYTYETTEEIKYNGKMITTLKFIVHRLDSSRVSYVWLSKKHYYLPLKVEQYKDGKLNIQMFMTQLKFKK